MRASKIGMWTMVAKEKNYLLLAVADWKFLSRHQPPHTYAVTAWLAVNKIRMQDNAISQGIVETTVYVSQNWFDRQQRHFPDLLDVVLNELWQGRYTCCWILMNIDINHVASQSISMNVITRISY